MTVFSKICISQIKSTIPHPSISTYNCNSLSYAVNSKDGIARHKKIISNIEFLSTVSLIVCIQETHLPTYEKGALIKQFPLHTIFYNNYIEGQAGTITMVHNSLMDFYNVTQHSLGKEAKGYAQFLRFNPTIEHKTDTLPFNLFNLYLKDGVAAIPAMSSLSKVSKKFHTFMVGDFNFTEKRIDSPSMDSDRLISGRAKVAWDKVVNRFGITEIFQPHHTHFHITTLLEKSRSSRIDRIYSSISEPERAVVSPYSYIPKLPTNILQSMRIDTGKPDNGLSPSEFRSDHLAVTLKFTMTNQHRSGKIHVPKWLAEDKETIADIEDMLVNVDFEKMDAYKGIEVWTKAVRKGVANYFKRTRGKSKRYQDEVSSLSAGFKLLKLTTKQPFNPDHVKQFLADHPFLEGNNLVPCLSSGNFSLPIDTSKIRAFLNALLVKDIAKKQPNSSFDPLELPPSIQPPDSSRGGSLLKKIKSRLPSDRTRLTALRESLDEEPTTDPKRMGEILQGYWGKIWKQRDDAPSSEEIDNYLHGYQPPIIPPSLLPEFPERDAVQDMINGSNDSSPGPDGIPFAFVRKFSFLLSGLYHRILYIYYP